MESPNVAILIDFENLVIGVSEGAHDYGGSVRPGPADSSQGNAIGLPLNETAVLINSGPNNSNGEHATSITVRRRRVVEAPIGRSTPLAAAPIDVRVLTSLARDHGAVAVARAYADWRLSTFNRYQTALYREAMDVVHVRGRRGKNAVDLRLAVDAIELLYERPDIETFVIVTGDRDFMHLFAKLKSHQRRVVMVAPASSASNDLAQACDRFVTYESLWRTQAGRPTAEMARQLERFKARLALVVSRDDSPGGMLGSRLKNALRDAIGPTFDEMSLGFSRFKDLIASCPGVVSVTQKADASDFLVQSKLSPAEAATLASALAVEDAPLRDEELDRFIGRAREKLGQWRYEWNPGRRRQILTVMFVTMRDAERFTQDDVIAWLKENPDAFGEVVPSTTQLSRYLSVFYQSTMFVVEAVDRDLPVRSRRLKLRQEYEQADDFIARYEQSILYKLVELLDLDSDSAVDRAQAVLGIDDAGDEEYVQILLEGLQALAGT